MANEQRKSGRRLEPIAIDADSILQVGRVNQTEREGIHCRLLVMVMRYLV